MKYQKMTNYAHKITTLVKSLAKYYAKKLIFWVKKQCTSSENFKMSMLLGFRFIKNSVYNVQYARPICGEKIVGRMISSVTLEVGSHPFLVLLLTFAFSLDVEKSILLSPPQKFCTPKTIHTMLGI